jgi:small subunit ribosomal protein S16
LATKIRLKRIGRRNRPFYRVVVMDSRNRRDGAPIEELGWFNPIETNKPFEIKEDRFMAWLKLGAQPSEAAHGLMKRSGLAHRWHLTQQGLDEAAVEKGMKKWVLTREETLKNRGKKSDKKAKDAEAKLKAEAEKLAATEKAVEETAEAPVEEVVKEEVSTKEEPEAPNEPEVIPKKSVAEDVVDDAPVKEVSAVEVATEKPEAPNEPEVIPKKSVAEDVVDDAPVEEVKEEVPAEEIDKTPEVPVEEKSKEEKKSDDK